MVFRDPDFDMPPNMILHERGSSPMQARSSTMNRKSFENSSYIDNRSSRDARSLNESPIASNASTPHLTPRLPVYYTHDKPSKHHPQTIHKPWTNLSTNHLNTNTTTINKPSTSHTHTIHKPSNKL